MSFKTTTNILDYSNELVAIATINMSVSNMVIYHGMAESLIETINSHLETGAFTGESRQELLDAKDNAWIVRRLMENKTDQ